MQVTFSEPRAAYLHVPFCAQRCGYCNFTVVAGRDDLIAAYLEALERELSWLERPREVDTLFVGGGTPTHLPLAALERLLSIAGRWFPLAAGHEFSVEANPADLTAEGVALLASRGATRISLGAQSFQPAKLRLLERDHAADDIGHSVEAARRERLAVSLDLIFAVPDETPDAWQGDLAAALDLAPDHISTYGLTFERGTTFWGRQLKGRLIPPGEELQREMYATAIDVLTAAGFEHYEVSNFALPGQACRHNEVYWSGESYFAAGPGAARYVGGRRETNHRSTTAWMQRVLAGKSPVSEAETLPPEDRAREALVLGLRRIAGVVAGDFQRRFGYDPRQLGGAALERFIDLGLIADRGGRLQLTRQGLFISDALWPEFLRE